MINFIQGPMREESKMKLFSKCILVKKPYEEVLRIIKSSAYPVPKGKFSEEEFSIFCSKRFNGGLISLYPLKGTIQESDNFVEVNVWVCADFGLFLGCFLCILGFAWLLWCLNTSSSRWIVGVGIVLFGAFVGALSICEGKALLDRLDHRLKL